MIKYIRDKAHCKHPSYTKEEVDTMIENKVDATEVYTKGNYAIGEITLTTEAEIQMINAKQIDYPEGFTKENTWVLDARYLNQNNNWVTQNIVITGDGTRLDAIRYALLDDYINVTGRLEEMPIGTETKIQLLLMKVE